MEQEQSTEQQQPSQTSQSKIAFLLQKIKNWYYEYKRVVLVTKKPTKEEYITIVKVSGLGILLIGLIGFIIQMIELILFK